MRRYIFTAPNIREADLQISIDAATPAEAVRLANAALVRNKFHLTGEVRFGDDQPPGAWMIVLSGKFDATMIVGEDVPPLADDLRQAYRFLDAAGYGYAWSGIGNLEDSLARDDAPLFTKPVWTEDGAGVDAFLQVRARYEDDAVGYGFRVEAMLYPTGRGDLARGEAPFRVRFEDKQHFIGADKLPLSIEVYEKKFLELINLIRRNNIAKDADG